MRNFVPKKLNICRNPYFPRWWTRLLDAIGQGSSEWGASRSRRAERVLQRAIEQKIIGLEMPDSRGRSLRVAPRTLGLPVLPLISAAHSLDGNITIDSSRRTKWSEIFRNVPVTFCNRKRLEELSKKFQLFLAWILRKLLVNLFVNKVFINMGL